MNKYSDKLEEEKQWYTQHAFQRNHFLNSKLFFSEERNRFNYLFPKRQLSNLVNEVIKAGNLDNPTMLIAPIGAGEDVQYFRNMTDKISGIDVSEEAINRIAGKDINKYVGDMQAMNMFPADFFDIVITPLFFHHYKDSFLVFLKEIYRVLRPGGYFFSLEPSLFCPACWITIPMKRIFGNITGQVEGEGPFITFRLSSAMKRAGFCNVKVFGASFSHNRMPIWLARIINVITYPFLKIPFLKHFSWLCVFYGEKKPLLKR